MQTNCNGCGQLISAGQKVFQLAEGEYMHSYITPKFVTSNAVIAEWHEECFRAHFSPQEQPYHCVFCGDEVLDGIKVMYITLGLKPSRPYKRLESRGYQLPWIAHIDCWQRLTDKRQ